MELFIATLFQSQNVSIEQDSFFLTVNQFIAVVIPIIGGFLIALYIIFSQMSKQKTVISGLLAEIDEEKKKFEKLENEIDTIKNDRHADLLGFTNTLNEFNVTLTGFRVTLNHMDNTMKEIKVVVENLRQK